MNIFILIYMIFRKIPTTETKLEIIMYLQGFKDLTLKKSSKI